jgi:hypothetical protein
MEALNVQCADVNTKILILSFGETILAKGQKLALTAMVELPVLLCKVQRV